MAADEWESLLRELVQAIQQVKKSGEVLSDEFQGMLAQTIGRIVDRIDQEKASQLKEPVDRSLAFPKESIGTNVSNDAQLLWVLAGQQPNAFISYLRTFPTNETRQLLNNPQQLNATIMQLQSMMPEGEPPVVNGIPHADLNSSNIWGAAYNPKTGKMRVRFQGGSEYDYEGIPANIFKAFIYGNAEAKTSGRNQYGQWWKGKNPSLGAALNQYIKGGQFPYQKIR